MFPQRQKIGLGFIGLFVMLMCAGSTWGSEAVSYEPNQPILFPPGNNIDRFEAAEGELPVSFPSRSKAASSTFENPQEYTYANFSTAFWESRVQPVDWKTLPIIPQLSETAREILLDGIAKGNNPEVFSTIGDCQSFPSVFMGIFDEPASYELPSDEGYLQKTIVHFTGSFTRQSPTVSNGFSAASVLSPLWGDTGLCQPSENPLECEFRIHRPITVFINLGTNWQSDGDTTHEDYLRQIVEFAIDRGVLPILSTKGDNIEGNHSVNEGIAKIAKDYEIPLWNFWWSIQYLPQHGIDIDRGDNYLSVAAWNKRSYSGLRMLHVVYVELMELLDDSS
jgi:hypothetical protein